MPDASAHKCALSSPTCVAPPAEPLPSPNQSVPLVYSCFGLEGRPGEPRKGVAIALTWHALCPCKTSVRMLGTHVPTHRQTSSCLPRCSSAHRQKGQTGACSEGQIMATTTDWKTFATLPLSRLMRCPRPAPAPPHDLRQRSPAASPGLASQGLERVDPQLSGAPCGGRPVFGHRSSAGAPRHRARSGGRTTGGTVGGVSVMCSVGRPDGRPDGRSEGRPIGRPGR